MDTEKNISLAVIRRLPKYYRYLGDLLDQGITRISSKELSNRINATASQIRQDLNNFGCFGQQGYGYNVEFLYNEIKKILGLDQQHAVIIIGAGKIGGALVNYETFSRRGFQFAAMFDVNDELIGKKINGVQVFHISGLPTYLKKNKTDIAVLCMPQEAAQDVCDTVTAGGVKAVWNFTPVDLKLRDGVVVENVHLTDSLMTLSYRLNEGNILENYRRKKE